MGRSVLEQRIHSEVKTLLQQFNSNRQPFDAGDPIYVSASNVMNALSFGGHFQHDDHRFREMIQKVNDNFANVGMSKIGTFIPGLIYLPGDPFRIKQTLKNAKDLYSIMREFATDNLRKYDESNIDNFTSAFIKEMKQQERTRDNSTFTSKYVQYF